LVVNPKCLDIRSLKWLFHPVDDHSTAFKPPKARYLDELARMRRSMALPAVSIQFPEASVWKCGLPQNCHVNAGNQWKS
jgi:hypothetical protein